MELKIKNGVKNNFFLILTRLQLLKQ